MEDNESVNVLHKRKYPKQIFTPEQLERRRINAKIKRDSSEKKYKCPHCEMRCRFPNVLNRHLKTHEKQRFKCEFCEELFDSHTSLRAHIKNKHKKLHQCSKCNYSSTVLSAVRKHFTAHHVNGIQCTVLGCTSVVAKNALKSHLETCHSSTNSEADLLRKKVAVEISCMDCDFACSSQEEMDLHVEKSHIGFNCPIQGCTRILYTSNLAEHLKHAHPEHSFEEESKVNIAPSSVSDCSSILNEDYASESQASENEDTDLDMELIVKKTVDILSCPDGEEQTFIRSSLGEFICCACKKKFSNRRYLTKHLNRVHYDGKEKKNIKKYPCQHPGCFKVFNAPCLATDHLNMHLDITPFQCEPCKMLFRGRARFAVHLKKYHRSSIRDYTSIQNNLPQLLLNMEDTEPLSESSRQQDSSGAQF